MSDEKARWLSCTYCGASMRDTAEENASFGIEPYPHDAPKQGVCLECGGDPKAKKERKRIGWASCMFFDARIKTLRETLRPEALAKFNGMSFAKKCQVIGKLIKKGLMI